MRRIPAKDMDIDATSKIEHVKSQEDRPDLQLTYSNMAICCPGNLENQVHCDKLKGNNSVTFNLNTQALQQSIRYSSQKGEIASNNAQWNNEIKNLLNLNHPILKTNRRNTLAGVIAAIDATGWSIKLQLEKNIENGAKKTLMESI